MYNNEKSKFIVIHYKVKKDSVREILNSGLTKLQMRIQMTYSIKMIILIISNK